jgi:hypothetical protein
MPHAAMSSGVHLGTDTEMARAFEAAWAAPTPDRLVALLHDDVVLLQPQLPPIRGKAAALAEFRRLFRWLPGTRGVVDRTVSAPGIAMIEWRLVFPIGRAGTSIPIVDRLTVRRTRRVLRSDPDPPRRRNAPLAAPGLHPLPLRPLTAPAVGRGGERDGLPVETRA